MKINFKKAAPLLGLGLFIAVYQADAQSANQGLQTLNQQLTSIKEPVRQTVLIIGSLLTLGALAVAAYKFFFDSQTSKGAIIGIVAGLICLGVASVI